MHQKVQKEEEGAMRGVIAQPEAAGFVLYQGGVGWHGAVAGSQGNLPALQTRLSD